MIFYKTVLIIIFITVFILYLQGGYHEHLAHFKILSFAILLLFMYIGIEFMLIKFTSIEYSNYIKLTLITTIILLIGIVGKYFIENQLTNYGMKDGIDLLVSTVIILISYIILGVSRAIFLFITK